MSLGEAVVEVGADTSGFQKGVEKGVESSLAKTSKAVEKVGAGMSKTGRKLTLGVTTPLVGIAGAALKTQMTFEQTMNVLQANTDAPKSAMKDLSDQAKQLGADTVFSANEAADAMLELAKGGFTPAQISGGGVQAVMALAATEGMNLADAATVVANNMNAFSIEASKASSVADALAAGSSASTASVASLAEGMSNVGGQARNFGLDLQETVGVLAAFDQNAIRGAEGGTALNSLLTKLSKPTAAAKKELKRFGIELTNADGEFRNITDIAGQFQRALGDLSEEERARVVTTIAGSYGQRALNALIKEGEGGLKKYIKQTRESGTAQKLADARMSGTAGAVERMSGALETAGLAIGEALAPHVTKAADKIAELADKFTELPKGTQKLIIGAAAAAAALGPLLLVVGSTVSAIGKIGGAASGAISWMSRLGGAADGTRTKMGLLRGGMRLLAGAGGMALLAKGAQDAGTKVGALETIAGGALTGAAFGGPLGAAVGTVAGSFLALKQNADAAAKNAEANTPKFQSYIGTFDKITKSATDATRAVIEHNLTQTQGVEAAGLLNVSQQQLVDAIRGVPKAQQQVNKALEVGALMLKNGTIPHTKAGSDAYNALKQSLYGYANESGRQSDGLIKDFRDQRQEFRAAQVQLEATRRIIEKWPSKKRTAFETNAPKTLSDVARLAREYDLTPKQVKTALEAAGVDKSVEQVRRFNEQFKGLDGKKVRPGVDPTFNKKPLTQGEKDLRRLGSHLTKPKVQPDTSALGKAVGNTTRVLNNLGKKKSTPTVDANTKPATKKTNSIERLLVSTVKKPYNALVDANTGRARGAVNSLKGDINGTRATIKVDASTSAALTAAQSVRATISNMVATISIFGKRVGKNANGTANWRGGTTLVGERGPELVNLPRGSRIHNAAETRLMTSDRSATVVAPSMPETMILRVGDHDFVAYVEGIADSRVEAADVLWEQGI